MANYRNVYKYRNERYATTQYITHKPDTDKPWEDYHRYVTDNSSLLEYKITKEICTAMNCRDIPLRNWRSLLMIAKCTLSDGSILAPFIPLPLLSTSIFYTDLNKSIICETSPELTIRTNIEMDNKTGIKGIYASYIKDAVSQKYPSSNWKNTFVELAKCRLCYLYITADEKYYLCVANEKFLQNLNTYSSTVTSPCSTVYFPVGQIGLRIKPPLVDKRSGLRITKNGALVYTGSNDCIMPCYRALYSLVMESITAFNIVHTLRLLCTNAREL